LIFSYNKLHIILTLFFLAFDDLFSGLECLDKLKFELDELFIELNIFLSCRNQFKSLMEQFSSFPHVSPNFDLIPDSDFPQLNLKGQESQSISQCLVEVFFTLDCNAERQILLPEVCSPSVLMHGPVPQFYDSSDDFNK
jgi:hypothetical protein